MPIKYFQDLKDTKTFKGPSKHNTEMTGNYTQQTLKSDIHTKT